MVIALNYAIAVLISAFGGALFLSLIKKYITVTSVKIQLDPPGMLERSLITVFVALGSFYVFFIPLIIFAKGIYIISNLTGWAGLLERREPTMAYQKVKLKSNIAVELLASPLFAIIVGIILPQF